MDRPLTATEPEGFLGEAYCISKCFLGTVGTPTEGWFSNWSASSIIECRSNFDTMEGKTRQMGKMSQHMLGTCDVPDSLVFLEFPSKSIT